MSGYQCANLIDEVKTSLFVSGPCPVMMNVYDVDEKPWLSRGNPKIGSCVMTVVGYDEKSFTLRNTWGGGGNGRYNSSQLHLPYNEFDWVCISIPRTNQRAIPRVPKYRE